MCSCLAASLRVGVWVRPDILTLIGIGPPTLPISKKVGNGTAIYIYTYIHICQATSPHALFYRTAWPRMRMSSTLARRQKRYAFCWSRLVRHLCIYRIHEASVNPLSNESIDLLLMGWMRGGNSSHRLQSVSRYRFTNMVHGQCSISTFTHSHCGPM